ncbi:uncharacterized protein LOC110031945 [Phalaenopsis equestris]|uniref:uncharacterized protein LOC110031945 n=1 Tax=Phalaenopsis equestris TaxID=78828 RepID=UPI0009E1F00A|nr:uncharacterized protein LOC110031945 [Phalaenopsis equestris]
MAWAATIVILLLEYYRSNTRPIPRMTSSYVGDKWDGEMLVGHPIRMNQLEEIWSDFSIPHKQLVDISIKNCIRAIDGKHVDARLPSHEMIAYIGRSGRTTQNVMAMCDFNMCFIFVMAGWEGSVHDSCLFSYATRSRTQYFPHSPSGKYYLVDAGYPMLKGYMKPFLKSRYHIPDFEQASGMIRGKKEMFNK